MADPDLLTELADVQQMLVTIDGDLDSAEAQLGMKRLEKAREWLAVARTEVRAAQRVLLKARGRCVT